MTNPLVFSRRGDLQPSKCGNIFYTRCLQLWEQNGIFAARKISIIYFIFYYPKNNENHLSSPRFLIWLITIISFVAMIFYWSDSQ